MVTNVDGWERGMTIKDFFNEGSDHKITNGTLKAGETLKIHMASGGGFAIKLSK